MQTQCEPCINHGLIGIKLRTLRLVPMDDIIQEACRFLEMDEKKIIGKDRYRPIVENRHMIMSYLSKERNFQCVQIGKRLNKDHTTIIHACSHVNDLCYSDQFFKDKYTQLVKHLNEM